MTDIFVVNVLVKLKLLEVEGLKEYKNKYIIMNYI